MNDIKVMRSSISSGPNHFTREQFVAALTRKKAEEIERIERRHRRWLDRFDEGRKFYGGLHLDLDSEDWAVAGLQEDDDHGIYSVFEEERLRRLNRT